ncbi:hypothetical protein [Glycomyces tenuis]|uniref:hypothetical protein n=1 Tax=Glycomyces tenuis TaxID=58116 RepID=UPI00040FB64F|nr:hypothetical protein [Glycomyces tenuis]
MSSEFREIREDLNTSGDVQGNLTPAEQAAADALMDTIGSSLTDTARAVVAAVRPEIYDEIATQLEQQQFLKGERAWPFVDLLRQTANGIRYAARQAEESDRG